MTKQVIIWEQALIDTVRPFTARNSAGRIMFLTVPWTIVVHFVHFDGYDGEGLAYFLNPPEPMELVGEPIFP